MRYITFKMPTISTMSDLTRYLTRTFRDYKINEQDLTVTIPVFELNDEVLDRISVFQAMKK